MATFELTPATTVLTLIGTPVALLIMEDITPETTAKAATPANSCLPAVRGTPHPTSSLRTSRTTNAVNSTMATGSTTTNSSCPLPVVDAAVARKSTKVRAATTGRAIPGTATSRGTCTWITVIASSTTTTATAVSRCGVLKAS